MSEFNNNTPKPRRLDKEQRLSSYASAQRMIAYLLMALVVLELADIPTWAIMPVFLIFLWMDRGSTIVGLQEKGWSDSKIAFRLLVDVLPLAAVTAVAFAFYTSPVPTGVAALSALGFYLFNRHRIMDFAVSPEVSDEEVSELQEAATDSADSE